MLKYLLFNIINEERLMKQFTNVVTLWIEMEERWQKSETCCKT